MRNEVAIGAFYLLVGLIAGSVLGAAVGMEYRRYPPDNAPGYYVTVQLHKGTRHDWHPLVYIGRGRWKDPDKKE